MVELLLVHLELSRDLAVVGAAPQLVLQLGVGAFDGPSLGPHRAGYPVDRAELVDDRPLDAADGVGLELEAAGRVELVDGVDEPEDPVADQVGLLDVLREARRDPAGDELDQRRVVQDQPLPGLVGAVLLVVAPELGDERRGVGFRHEGGWRRRPPGVGPG